MIKRYYPLRLPDDTAWERRRWLRYVPRPLKNLVQGIYNIIRWIPTIYRDRDWDHAFLNDMLQKKLEYMRKELVYANRHQGVCEINKDLTLALNLLQRIKEDYYDIEMYDYYKVNHTFKPVGATGDYLTIEETIVENRLAGYLFKYRRIADKLRKEHNLSYKDNATLARLVAYHNQDRCARIFWKLLYYKQNQWWD
jgi:hypothetical protein